MNGFHKLRLKSKLLIIFISVATTPFIVGLFSAYMADEALMKEAFNELDAVHDIKKTQIRSYFAERKGDITVFSSNDVVKKAIMEFETAFMRGGLSGRKWNALNERYQPVFKQYNDEYGYYDVFLIATDGDIIYTVAKEKDIGQNLIRGELATTNLAEAFRLALKKDGIVLVDFKWYAISNEPAAFIASPVKTRQGQVLGVLAYQISLKQINKIMQERTGMGKTGETYLVGRDLLMRSDSYLDPKNHSVVASFHNPESGKVDTIATREAFQDRDDKKIIIDYNGNPVLSTYGPVQVFDGITWAIIAEIDEAEVKEPIYSLILVIVILSSVIVIVSIGASLWVTRNVTMQLGTDPQELAAISNTVGEGDLTIDTSDSHSKTGVLNSILSMVTKLASSFTSIKSGSDQISLGSEQMAMSSQQLSQGTSEQASSVEQITAAITELAAQAKQASGNAEQAKSISQKALDDAGGGLKRIQQMVGAMNDISVSSGNISKIMKSIDEIAFQTNLLALNAAVEAARAGRHGKGFAVVAEEVNNLSQRSSQAARESAEIIETTIAKIDEGKNISDLTEEAFRNILDGIKEVSGLIDEVFLASQQQAKGIEQVVNGVGQIDQVTQHNASIAEENAASAEELSGQARQLMEVVSRFKLNGHYSDGKIERTAIITHGIAGESVTNRKEISA